MRLNIAICNLKHLHIPPNYDNIELFILTMMILKKNIPPNSDNIEKEKFLVLALPIDLLTKPLLPHIAWVFVIYRHYHHHNRHRHHPHIASTEGAFRRPIA